MQNAVHTQYLCVTHNYGWNETDEGGQYGCRVCYAHAVAEDTGLPLNYVQRSFEDYGLDDWTVAMLYRRADSGGSLDHYPDVKVEDLADND
jgi:hypothetical protein